MFTSSYLPVEALFLLHNLTQDPTVRKYFSLLVSMFVASRLWCWEVLGAGGEGDDRGWDGWMVSLTQWMWVWVNSGSWWWTGKPGMLRFMGSQRVGHDWATELNWLILVFASSAKLITLACHSLPLKHETREHQPLTASANVEILQIASSSHIPS